jgi:N-acetylneuraminate synthase
MKNVVIDQRSIGPGEPPFVIAEISANHGGDLTRAKKIMRIAKDTGADAVKLQLYTADSLTLDSDRDEFRIQGKSLWQGRRLYELYQSAATPAAWFPELFDYGRELGIIVFASVFDRHGIELLEKLNAPAYKIASFEAVDLDLISATAQTGKPTIISTGLCALEEIEDAVAAYQDAGGKELILLRCNSAYPASAEEANLASIPHLIEKFGLPVGYSDHTLDAFQAITAVALGACVIEKHIIDAREPATADSAFSSLPDQFAELIRGCKAAHEARGAVSYGPTDTERGSLIFRRSLFAAQPIKAGEIITRGNVRSVRPGHGLAPKHLKDILGRTAKRDIAFGEPLTWDLIK